MPSTNSLAMPIWMPHSGIPGADALDRLEGGQEVGVAGRPRRVQVDAVGAGLVHALGDVDDVVHRLLHGLLLGRPRLVDAAQRQQLRPVGHGAVGDRVAAEVGHGAVLDGDGEQELGPAHGLLLERQHRLDRLEGVVVVIELHGVGAHRLLEGLQVVDARPHVLAADAVRAQDDLVADVDGAEAGACSRRRPPGARPRRRRAAPPSPACTPASTPAATSAAISARVIRTSDPSPMRVGILIAPPCVSWCLRPPTPGGAPSGRRDSRLQARPPAVSGRYFGKVDGATGQTAAPARRRRRRRA